jgi:hypothetical protein
MGFSWDSLLARKATPPIQTSTFVRGGQCCTGEVTFKVDNYILQVRYEDAQRLFNRLLSRCNDVGLLAEEFDPLNGRMLGNFPQAYSHVGLINCALNLSREIGPTEQGATTAGPVPSAVLVCDIRAGRPSEQRARWSYTSASRR